MNQIMPSIPNGYFSSNYRLKVGSIGAQPNLLRVGSSKIKGLTLGGSPIYHPEAVDWVNRVQANSGVVSFQTLDAVSRFCYSIDYYGLRNKFLRLNLFCGADLNACFTPLYLGPSFGGTQYGFTTDQNNGPFGSIDYTETGAGGGLTGSNYYVHYLSTGLSSTTPFSTMGIAYNNIHASVYLSNLGTTEGWMGGVIGGSVFGFEGNEYSGTTVFWGFGQSNNWNSPAGSYLSNSSCSNEGFIVCNLNSGNDTFSIQNTDCTDLSDNSNVYPYYTGTNIYIMQGPIGYFIGGSEPIYNPTDDTVAGYSLGTGFTLSEITSYNTIMNTFQTALSRNI